MNALTPIAQAEILGPDDDIRVYCAPHPLRDERHLLRAPAGSTVAEIVDLAIAATGSPCPASDFVVLLSGVEASAGDGQQVLPEFWHRVRPKPGTSVAMRPVPKAPLVGLLVPTLTGLLGGGLFASFAAQLIVAGLMFGVKFLLNKLFAPKERNDQQIQPKASYSITGSRNQMAPDGVIPVIYGTHRVAPYLAAQPYTETVGDDQYLRQLFIVGYGPLDITEVKIGETPISHFDGVDIQIKEGYADDTATTIVPRQPFQQNLSIDLLNADGFHSLTTPDNIQRIHIDLIWPQGLMYINPNDRYDMGSAIQWRYREVGTTPWTTFSRQYVAKTQDVIRKTLTADVAAGQYEVEVRKLNADIVAVSGDFIFDKVQWSALRTFRFHQPITFPKPLALIAIRIKGTGQLNGIIDTLNCVASSRVTAYTTSGWVANTISSNPAAMFRHALQHRSNPKPVPDRRIDLNSLINWHQYCVANGFTYKKPVMAQVSVFDQLQEICAAGRASPVFKDGKWSAVWDEQNPPVVQMFTPSNSWGFEGSKEYQDPPHAFRMRFVNASKGFIDDERTVYDDGYTAATATKFQRFEMPGVTDATSIWKHGRYHIAQARLRPEVYTLNTDLEGLVLTRGDRVRVQHDLPLIGLGSGRVVAVDTTPGAQLVEVNEELTLGGGTYGFRFRLPNNTYLTRTVDPGTTPGIYTVIPLSGSGSMPAVDDLFAFGIVGDETGVFRVLGIEPQEDMVHRVTLVDDAPGISLADTGTIPEFDSQITTPVDPFELPPIDLRLVDGVHEEDGTFFAFITASWTSPPQGKIASYQTQIRSESDPDLIWKPGPTVGASENSATFRKLSAGLYTVRVRSIFIDRTWSRFNTSAVYNAQALLDPPADVTDFRIATLGDNSTLTWTPILGTAITYQIRFSPLLTGVTWNTATPLFPSLSGSSVQVPTAVGTYLIKAQRPNGFASANATLIVAAIAALQGFNAVDVITESPTFPGAKTDVEVVGSELRLLPSETIADWVTLSAVTSMLGDGGHALSVFGTYEFDGSVDLGDVYTSRISAAVEAYGLDFSTSFLSTWQRLSDIAALDTANPDDWEVTLEYRSSLDMAIWTDWQQFYVGDVTARAFEFRLQLYGRPVMDLENGVAYSLTTPSVISLAVNVDMPDRVIGGNDIAVTGAGLTVPFDPPFLSLKGFAINAQNMATGDYATVTAKDETGFHIIFKNAAGTGVARTFDYSAVGYGLAA